MFRAAYPSRSPKKAAGTTWLAGGTHASRLTNPHTGWPVARTLPISNLDLALSRLLFTFNTKFKPKSRRQRLARRLSAHRRAHLPLLTKLINRLCLSSPFVADHRRADNEGVT